MSRTLAFVVVMPNVWLLFRPSTRTAAAMTSASAGGVPVATWIEYQSFEMSAKVAIQDTSDSAATPTTGVEASTEVRCMIGPRFVPDGGVPA